MSPRSERRRSILGSALPGHPITAWAACNALGGEVQAIEQALFAGLAGIRPTDFADLGLRPFGSVPAGLEPLTGSLAPYDTRQARITARVTEPLVANVQQLVNRHGSSRVGIVVGTSTGGIEHTEAAVAHWQRTGVLPDEFDLRRKHQMSATTDVIRRITGANGPSVVVSTACSSSGKAFAVARRWLRCGRVDAVLVGGIDSRCSLTVHGFAALDVLSERPCRPFGRDRDGINLGEAATLMLVQREGDAPACLLGVGESSDAHHMSAPHPEGAGAALAMRRDLMDAGLAPEAVGHVNAHGTATVQGDAAEARAIVDVLGPDMPVWCAKGAVGHTLGAAGATEALFSVLALARGRLPGSIGSDPADRSLGIDVVSRERALPEGVVLSNSFAFGGSNVCVVLGGVS